METVISTLFGELPALLHLILSAFVILNLIIYNTSAFRKGKLPVESAMSGWCTGIPR